MPPNLLSLTGVRRVNNMPLIIFGITLTIFLIIMAMVAVNRANRKESTDNKQKGGNSLQFANSITKQWQTGIIPAKELPPPPPPLVVPMVHVDLDHPPPPTNHDSSSNSTRPRRTTVQANKTSII